MSGLALILTQRHGRRPLLSAGLAGIIATLLTAGVALHLPPTSGKRAATVAALPAFMTCQADSAGPIA